MSSKIFLVQGAGGRLHFGQHQDDLDALGKKGGIYLYRLNTNEYTVDKHQKNSLSKFYKNIMTRYYDRFDYGCIKQTIFAVMGIAVSLALNLLRWLSEHNNEQIF